MKYYTPWIFTLLLCAGFLLLNAQQPPGAAKQINIPGTKVFLMPPPGFKLATNFAGLEKGENAMVQVYDLVGGDYYQNAKSFSRENFEAKGIKVFDFGTTTVQGFPAKYILLQGQGIKSYELVFGDTTFSVMIITVYLPGDEQTGKQLKECLSSVVYKKKMVVDPFASASFKVVNNTSRFKFARYSAGMFTFSLGGVVKEVYDNEPMLMVNPIPLGRDVTAQNLLMQDVEAFRNGGMTGIEIRNSSDKAINGYDAYQCEVYGTLKGKSNLLFITVLIKDGKALTIQGITYSSFIDNLKEFKVFTASVRFK